VNDIEQLKMIELESQLRFARGKIEELKGEIERIQGLLNDRDIIKKSLSDEDCPFNHLKSSYKHKKT
jgi:TolA-binding protein